MLQVGVYPSYVYYFSLPTITLCVVNLPKDFYNTLYYIN